jgi:hypothetical protein
MIKRFEILSLMLDTFVQGCICMHMRTCTCVAQYVLQYTSLFCACVLLLVRNVECAMSNVHKNTRNEYMYKYVHLFSLSVFNTSVSLY